MVPLVPSDPSAPASPGGGVRISGGAERQLKIARNVVHGNFFILNKLHSSLYCLKGHHPIRRQLFDVIDGVIFNRIIGAFILLNVVCTILDTPGWRDLNGVEDFLYACDICFQVVFTLEMFTKIAALGFALHRHSFLRAPQNAVDMLLVVIGFAQFITSNTLVKQLLRLTRSLRAFAYLTRFPLLRSIFVALRQAAAPLRDVLLLMCFIILSMAVLGLQLFSGTMHNRCYLNTPLFSANGSIVPNATQWVIDPNFASMPCSTTASIGFNCPTPGSVCDRHDDVFYFRYRNFDYIWTSTYAVFKFVTLDNWPSDIQYIEAANGSAYFIFACVIVIFGTYFTLNLVLAVLSGVFEEVTEEEDRLHEQANQLRAEVAALSPSAADLLAAAVTNFRLSEQQVVTTLNAFFETDPSDSAPPTPPDAAAVTELEPGPEPTADADKTCLWTIRRPMWAWVVRRAWFQRLALVMTVINLVVLAMDHYGIDDTWDTVNNWINFVCTVWFLVEAACKILAMGTFYFRDFFNDFDFALCAISIVELSVSGISGGSSATVLRGFRLARVVRVVNRSKHVRQLLLTVAQAGYASALLFVFLIMYIVVGAVFSVVVFPDAVPASTRPNFTNFLNSLLAIFLIISGENWNDDVASVMTGYSTTVIALFIPFYILATYIVINFVVVILIKSFNSAAEKVNEEEDLEMLDTAAAQLVNMARNAEWNPLQGVLEDDQAPTVQAPSASTELIMSDALDDDAGDDGDDSSLDEYGFAPVSCVDINSGKTPPPLVKQQQGPATLLKSTSISPDSFGQRMGGPKRVAFAASSGEPQGGHGSFEVPSQEGSSVHDAPPIPLEQQQSKLSAWLQRGLPRSVLDFKLRDLLEFSPIAFIADFFGMPKDPHEAFARVHGRSLGLFSIENPVRRASVLLCSHPFFELVGMLIVVLGCIALALDNREARTSDSVVTFLLVTSYITVAFFTLELILKLFAFGGVVGQYAYFRSIQNCIDFVALLLAYLGLFFPLGAAQSMRVFRFASRWKSLRLILTSLVTAIPGIANIFGLIVFVYFVIGCLGVQIFKGSFFTCNDSNATTSAACVGNMTTTATAYNHTNGTFYPYEAQTVASRYWDSAFFNFNHLGQAYLSMIVLQFSDGWSQLLFYAMDSNSDTDAMTLNNTWWWAILICYLFMQNNYFLNNLFVGSLMDSFSAEREKASGKIDATGRPLLSEAQERWIREYRFLCATKLPPIIPSPGNRVRRFCAWLYFADNSRLDARPAFDWTITACILVNVAFMMSQYDGQPDYWTQTLYWINIGFAAVFGLEFVIKIIAMMPYGYFDDRWNVFDFLMLVSAIISIFFNGPGMNAVRIFRVARVLRLIRRAKGLYRLFESLVYALPQLLNVIVINLLVLFVFGVIGVSLFQDVYWDSTGSGTLGPYFNFDNLPNAVMLLFQISTTESWGSVLQACLVTEVNSNCSNAAGSCGTYAAYPYFLAFMLVANSVCVNLLILIVVDNFEEVSQLSSKMSQFLLYRMEIFRRRWSKLDTDRVGALPWATFVSLIRQMHYQYETEYEAFTTNVWVEGSDTTASRVDETVLDDVPSDDDEVEMTDSVFRPSSADFKDPVALRILGSVLGLDGFQSKEELEQGIRNRFHIPTNLLNDGYFIQKVTSMNIPVSVHGTVFYKDCILGIVKEFHHAEDDASSEEGADFLRSIVDYDRLGVFKLHHAIASAKIQRAFVSLLRRKGSRLSEKTPVVPMEPEESSDV